MDYSLTLSLYNFTGVAIDNLSVRSQDVVNNAASLSPVVVAPNTPETPQVYTADSGEFADYFLYLKYYAADGSSAPMTTPITSGTRAISVYFVNNNGIDFTRVLPQGGDITPYLYSSGYQRPGASIVYRDKYAPATSYNFGPRSIVVALPANRTITSLTQVPSIDWIDPIEPPEEASSYTWLLILIIIVVIILIIFVVIAAIAYKKSSKAQAMTMYYEPGMTTISSWETGMQM